MERNSKRIVAIVAVAVIVVGGVVGGILIYLLLPTAPLYEVPGAPPGYDPEKLIKIGVLGDLGEIWGDGAYEGAWLAAYDINSDGGIEINNSQSADMPNGTYYIAIAKEDTNEQDPNLQTPDAVAAAKRMMINKMPHFCIGGSRTEALDAYVGEILDRDTIFIGTGASDDAFCERVLNSSSYPEYKYFFRMMPTNSSTLGDQIFQGLMYYIYYMNATHPNYNVSTVGILYEDLDWTDALVAGLPTGLPYYYNLIFGAIITVPSTSVRGFDPGSTTQDIKTHLDKFSTDQCDVVIPIISGADGIKMVTQWYDSKKEYMLLGIDVQSQSSDYWTQTGGKCEYEIQIQAITDTNKTSLTKAFWSAFNDKWDHDPLYTAAGSYDAVQMIAYAVNTTQSLNSSLCVTAMEARDLSNPKEGVGGVTAFLASHDLYAGVFPYGISLWAQWQADATKVCLPAPLYAAAQISTGTIQYPDWINTAWA